MKLLKCRICGGDLKQENGDYVCAYCHATYADDTLERAYDELKNSLESVARNVVEEAFVLEQEKSLANLRRQLFEKTHEKYINSNAIVRICRKIQDISPDDFAARFYEVMNDESDEARRVTEFLDKIDVKNQNDYVEDVVDFVLKSLKIEYLPSLNLLVERAYNKNKAKYEEVMTRVEAEAEKVENGLYEPQLSRDVFVAYSSRDIQIVNALVSYLENQGVSCFLALRNLQHGRKAVENYEKALETAMDNCRIFLFVSSKNSRSLSCDAVKREIPYIKKKDLEFKPEYRNNYEKMPEKYRKPRIQYRIDDEKTPIVDRQIGEFFGSLQWRCDLDSVATQIGEYLNQEIDEPIESKQEPKPAQPQQPAFDQKALYEFFKQIRNEEENEKVRQAEEKRKAEEKIKEEIRLAEFEIENGLLKKYNGAGGAVVIPNGVTEIGEKAFYESFNLTSVEIPSSVTVIDQNAFQFCKALTSLKIPSSVTSIGRYAFGQCSNLTDIEIPSSVTNIGDCAFMSCNLTSVKIPSSVTSIGSYLFGYCKNLKSVEIPSGITSIGENAFAQCPKLTSVKIPSGVTSIGDSAFYQCSGLTSVEIPSSVESIGKHVFSGCLSLTSITIPDGVTSIGYSAFHECALTSVKIPSSVKNIGDWAFSGCSGLTSVVISDGVTIINSNAFSGCSNLTIYAEAKSKPVGWNEKWNPNNRPVVWGYVEETISKTVSVENPDFEIENGVLKKYKGKGGDVVVPNGVSTIGEYAFELCSQLTGVTIPPSVTNIRTGAFSYCTELKHADLSDGVREIEDYAFNKCEKLLKIEIPSSVKSIGDGAFKDCSRLKSATIPFSVAKMGHAVFQWCNSVTVYTEASRQSIGWESSWNPDNRPVVWGHKAGDPIPKTVSVENPDFEIENGVLKKYKGAGGCAIIPDGVTVIGERAFYGHKTLTGVEIPKGVTKINSFAFGYCGNLTEITIPNGVREIEDYAFTSCEKLEKIAFPSSLTEIGRWAFTCCQALSNITVDQGNRTYYSQENCLIKRGTNALIIGGGGVTVIPNGVTRIGEYAFNGRKSLTSVEISDDVTEIGGYAFSGCYALKEIVLPKNVKKMKTYAFGYCSALSKIILPKSVTEIEKDAFIGCEKLEIYADAASKPVGWAEGWNPLNRPVVWGYNANATSANTNQAQPKNLAEKVNVSVPTETVNIHLKHSSSPLSPANGSTYVVKIGDKISTKVVTGKTDTFGELEAPIGTHTLSVALFGYGDPNCRGNAIWTSNAQSITIEKGKSYRIEITPYKFLGSPKIDIITQ